MENLNIETGNRIKECREKIGLTQNELAEQINSAANHISCLERGKRRLTLEMANRLSPILNVSTDYLLCNSDFEDKNSNPTMYDAMHGFKSILEVLGFTVKPYADIDSLSKKYNIYTYSEFDNTVVERWKSFLHDYHYTNKSIVFSKIKPSDCIICTDDDLIQLTDFLYFTVKGWLDNKLIENNLSKTDRLKLYNTEKTNDNTINDILSNLMDKAAEYEKNKN